MKYILSTLFICIMLLYEINCSLTNRKETEFDHFIGKKFKHNSDHSSNEMETHENTEFFLYKHQLPGNQHRIMRPNSMATMDHVPNRFNVVLDEEDRVKKTYWG